MPLVQIDNLAAGMILKKDVCDRSGRLLLPEGAELTEKHLRIFRTWGILEADIAGDSDGEGGGGQFEEIDPEIMAAAEEAVGALFIHNDPEQPAIKELIRLCVVRRASHAS